MKITALILITIIAILGGAIFYSNHQDTQRQKATERAEQLRTCQAPYEEEYKQGQIAFANPLYVTEGSAAMQHATDGLKQCREEFGVK